MGYVLKFPAGNNTACLLTGHQVCQGDEHVLSKQSGCAGQWSMGTSWLACADLWLAARLSIVAISACASSSLNFAREPGKNPDTSGNHLLWTLQQPMRTCCASCRGSCRSWLLSVPGSTAACQGSHCCTATSILIVWRCLAMSPLGLLKHYHITFCTRGTQALSKGYWGHGCAKQVSDY